MQATNLKTSGDNVWPDFNACIDRRYPFDTLSKRCDVHKRKLCYPIFCKCYIIVFRTRYYILRLFVICSRILLLPMALYIQLLGDFSLKYKGEPCYAVDGARLQSLLAYLLLRCQTPQARQTLAFQFWPDSTEQQARNNLRKSLHKLRRAVPNVDQLLQLDTRTVQWRYDSSYVLDVHEFEHKLRRGVACADDPASQQRIWEEAISLYRGDLLSSCYDDWILPERQRLRHLFIETLEKLIWLTEDRRQLAQAIHYAQQILHYDPLHEETYRRLMRLYAVSGDRVSAIRTYHTCLTFLQQELDVEPGPQIQQAYVDLLEMEVPAKLRIMPAAPVTASLQLVGRESAWQALQSVWRRTVQGKIHFCFIWGEAGIGKTRLAEEFLDWATRQGIATARARAYTAVGFIYTPVIEWLRSDAMQPVLDTADDVWLAELAHLLPELLVEHTQLPHLEPWAATGPSQWQRQRLFDALNWAMLADSRPKLLLIDDLQWCDSETLAWLHYLLRFARGMGHLRQPSSRILIVATVRSEAVGENHPITLLRHDVNHGVISDLVLTPLNTQQAAELATQTAQKQLNNGFATALHHLTDGNPRRIIETVLSENCYEALLNAAVLLQRMNAESGNEV